MKYCFGLFKSFLKEVRTTNNRPLCKRKGNVFKFIDRYIIVCLGYFSDIALMVERLDIIEYFNGVINFSVNGLQEIMTRRNIYFSIYIGLSFILTCFILREYRTFQDMFFDVVAVDSVLEPLNVTIHF